MRIADILRTLANNLEHAEGGTPDPRLQNPAELIDVEVLANNDCGADEVNDTSVIPSQDNVPTEEQDIINLIKQLSGMPTES